ncbi:MAG: hypothetical protein LBS86_00960 [Treponema sp.]|nr:hypothetical protein [Treponema sp.]
MREEEEAASVGALLWPVAGLHHTVAEPVEATCLVGMSLRQAQGPRLG